MAVVVMVMTGGETTGAMAVETTGTATEVSNRTPSSILGVNREPKLQLARS